MDATRGKVLHETTSEERQEQARAIRDAEQWDAAYPDGRGAEVFTVQVKDSYRIL